MSRILITGVTGLVGHGIARYFLDKKWQVFGTSRLKLDSLHPLFTPIKFNLNSKNNISKLTDCLPINAIIHCAAKLPYTLKDENDIDKFYSCNVDGTRHLLEWSKVSNINKFIYISGTSVKESVSQFFCKNGKRFQKKNHYLTSKAMGELLCGLYNNSNLSISVLRTKAPYGYISNQSVIPRFLDLSKKSKDLELWGKGSRTQIFTFVEDIGLACELLIKNKKSNTIYNITGDEIISMKELAETIIKLSPNSKSKIVFLDRHDPEENIESIISIEKARKELNFSPRFSMDTGLKKVTCSSNNNFFSRPN